MFAGLLVCLKKWYFYNSKGDQIGNITTNFGQIHTDVRAIWQTSAETVHLRKFSSAGK